MATLHPELAVDVLRRRGKIDTNWLNAYSQRLIEMGGGKTPAETAAKA